MYWLDRGNYQTSYNVAPTSYQPVIRMEHGSKQTVVHTMKWGLVPCWSKSLPNSMKTANCRDDSLIGNGKSMFSSMKNAKRCIVLVQGFYEWLTKGKQKIPYYFKRKDGELLFFAGLYDSVRLPELLFTYTIITTSPAKFMSHIHNRMPVILEKESSGDIANWLNPDIRWNSELAALLKPYEREDELECYQVTQDVNKVGTDSPRFVKPVNNMGNDDKKEVKQEQFNNSDNEIHVKKKLCISGEVGEDNEEEEEKKPKRKKSTSSIKKKNAKYNNRDDDREDNESLSKKNWNKKESIE
ncbi:3905_t:CDS:2 [Diversispora eburnea]|uniref:3905_t:CDS:1 n=1 Tax=Diversispora eburnea TaxID=1213867 RepID=A0A9N9F300_9GLOM|nr:3905_t:CDS:2 [Diversispora eburnea]